MPFLSLAYMADSHVISGLVSKRSELAGIIAHHQKEITRLSSELKTVDAAIKLFDPDYRVQGIKAKRYHRKNKFFEHGESNKVVLDIVRKHQPIGASGIVEEAARIKGIDIDSELFAAFKASLKSTVKRQKIQGVIIESGGKEDGSAMLVIA